MVSFNNILQYNPTSVQSVVSFFWYVLIGGVFLMIFVYLMVRLYKSMTYNYSVDIYKKVGDTTIQAEDKAKTVKLDGDYMMHYASLNKYSPVIPPEYHRIKKTKLFGILPTSKLHFSIFLHGESIFPVKVQDKSDLLPINIDLFNYAQARIRANAAKYVKINVLMQMLPYLALGAVVMMFIVGMIFYTKHIETISRTILNAATDQATRILEKGGVVQVIP